MSVFDQLQHDDDRPILSGPFVSALTIAAAGVVYVMTRHPLLAGILPWLHGGWPTFSTGIWILRSDPQRARARVCFLFYFAAACWKAAVVAFATTFVIAIEFLADEIGSATG